MNTRLLLRERRRQDGRRIQRMGLFSEDSLLSAKTSGCATVERQLELMVDWQQGARRHQRGIRADGTSRLMLSRFGRQHVLQSDAGCICCGLSGKPCMDCAFRNRFSWVHDRFKNRRAVLESFALKVGALPVDPHRESGESFGMRSEPTWSG